MAAIREVKTRKGKGFLIDYYDLDGTRKRKVVYRPKREVEAIAQSLEGKKANVKLGLESVLKRSVKLADAVKYYLKFAENQKCQNTIKRELLAYNAFQGFIGNVPVGSIHFGDMEAFTRKRFMKDSLKPDSVNIEIRILRQFFNFLIKHEFIKDNPTKGLKGPKKQEKDIRFLTVEEIDRLINVIDSQDYRDLVLTYLNTGARRSELLPPLFQWENVNFQLRRIKLKGKGNKVRYVPMNDSVYEILYRRKVNHRLKVPFEFDYHWLYKRIKKYLKKAEIEDATIHTLRKTFGSLMIQNGIDIFTVSKLLGHSSVLVSERHYAALLEDNLSQGVKVLDKVVGKK